MKIYISGPMSGLPDLNFPAFAEAAKKLAQDGHEPINPATLNRDGAIVRKQMIADGWHPKALKFDSVCNRRAKQMLREG